MSMSFQFQSSHRRAIHEALSRFLQIDEDTQHELIEAIEQTGYFCVFGYGSLIGDPHAGSDEQFLGIARGVKRDAVFSDRYYCGKPDRLGLTLGLAPTGNLDDKLYGLVHASHIGASEAYNSLLDNIMALVRRETSFNPIYTYKIIDVEVADNRTGPVKAVACGTDEQHPQYVGPTVEDSRHGHLTFAEKAAVIADSYGHPGASVRSTGLAYWRYILDCSYQIGVEPEPHIRKLVAITNAFRTKLPPEAQERLSLLERSDNLDPRVYEVDEAAMAVSPTDVADYLRRGRDRLGNKDPLSPKSFGILSKIMADLNMPDSLVVAPVMA